MNNFKNYIINLHYKKLFLLHLLFNSNLLIAYIFTNHRFENGYHFFYLFFSILPVDMLIIILMLRSIYQLEGPPRSPFYLLKYSFYFMILIFGIAPFLYLWGMRDVISHLKW
jgi:hypothetical protein